MDPNKQWNKPQVPYNDIGKSSLSKSTPNTQNAIYGQQQQFQVNQKQAQMMAEIRYTVYQDLQYLINLMYSMSQVNETFKNAADKTMVTISKNKIILQLNLSNTIHQDLEMRSQGDPILQEELQRTKDKAAQIAKQAKIDPTLQELLNKYLNNNLSKIVRPEVLPLDQVHVQGNFNENVVQQIISSVQKTDQQYERIRQNPSQIIDPKPAEVFATAEKYKQLTAQKLNQNFPKQRW